MDMMAPRLVLGWWLDGAPGPGTGGLTAAVGPSGFLDLLAAWHGVATRREPAPVRIAACQAVLREDPKDAFWSVSFSKDGWSTAWTVLELRDRLLMAGWDGTAEPGAPVRISDLACISLGLAAGEPDLLAAVLVALASRSVTWPKIALAEPAVFWPFGWRQVFAALERQGVALEELTTPPPPGGEDLGSLRAAKDGGKPVSWRGDGSVCLLTSETEEGIADVMSAWLAGSPDGVALVKRSGGLLDPFLRARHLPRLGGDAGPAAGVLPLALALRWDPFDASAALEFLSLHSTPLGRAARFLSDAIAEKAQVAGARRMCPV